MTKVPLDSLLTRIKALSAKWLTILLLLTILSSVKAAVVYDNSSILGPVTGELKILTYFGSANVKGVVIFMVQNVGQTDEVTGVTYGGVNVPFLCSFTRGTGEPGRIQAYFKGSGLPVGTVEVIMSVNGTGSEKAMFLSTVTAATASTAVNVYDNTSITSTAVQDPSATLSLGGITSFVVEALHSGEATTTSITQPSGWSNIAEPDFGNQMSGSYRYNTIASTNVTFGWTQASNDALCIAVAITEVSDGAPSPSARRRKILGQTEAPFTPFEPTSINNEREIRCVQR